MNEIFREDVDLEVAFASAIKRRSIDLSLENTGSQPVADGQSEATIQPVRSRSRDLAVRLVRAPAALVYRLVVPIIRPVAVRWRRYLIEGLRQELLVELADVRRTVERTADQSMTTAGVHRQLLVDLVDEVAEGRADLEMSISAVYRQLLDLEKRVDRVDSYAEAAARRTIIPSSGGMLLRTNAGYVLCPPDDHAVLATLVESGDLERGTRLLISRFLGEGDVFIDVGANLGLHTLVGARAVGPLGRVIAFEPFEPTARLLEKTLWINGVSESTTVVIAAVSDVVGTHTFYLGQTSGHHSLLQSVDQAGTRIEVPTTTLDESLGGLDRIDLLKIDVEGAELSVMRGATGVVAGHPNLAIIVEFGPAHMAKSGTEPGEWLESFGGLGFEYRVIDPDLGTLSTATPEMLSQMESANLFLARPGSRAWDRITDE